MSRAAKGAQRAWAAYDDEVLDSLSVYSVDIDGSPITPVLVIPEQALKDCAKKGHPNRTGTKGSHFLVCPDCGAHRVWSHVLGWGRWIKPTLLRVARRKR